MENFGRKIEAAEKKTQSHKPVEERREDIVDEKAVQSKLDGLYKHAKQSPVAEKYKKKITDKLDKKVRHWEKRLGTIKENQESKLQKLESRINKDLDKFDQSPGVKEVYEVIEPFFANKDALKSVINYKSYKKRSGYWKKIMAELESKTTINNKALEKAAKKAGKEVNELTANEVHKVTQRQVAQLQKVLKIKADGKIGPQTINAMADMLGFNEIKVAFSSKTEKVEVVQKKDEKPKVTAKKDTPQVGAKVEVKKAPPKPAPRPAPKTEPKATPKPKPAPKPSPVATQKLKSIPKSDPPHDRLGKVRPEGFARRFQNPEAQKILDRMSLEQKLNMIKAAQEKLQISPQQKRSLDQVQIVETVLNTIYQDIKSGGRTWAEWLDQTTEFEGTTHKRSLQISMLINGLDDVRSQIINNPKVTVDRILDPKIKLVMQRYNMDRGHKAEGQKFHSIMNETGKIIEAKTPQDLQAQYAQLVAFLRDQKDYAAAQVIMEEKILGKHFAKARTRLEKEESEKVAKLKFKAEENISKKITATIKGDWIQKGMTAKQIEKYTNSLEQQEHKRLLNKLIASQNNGLPFKGLKGYESAAQNVYKDMMGTGEWHNFADATWDKIVEEVIINAPLIIVSGGAASLARAGISNGARALITSARLARIGEIAASTGRAGKATRLAGRLGGLAVEGATFDIVHTGLQNPQALLDRNLPQWGEAIVTSSLTLGAFHLGGALGKRANKWLSKNVTKFSDKSIGNTIQNLIITGNTEAGLMLAIGAIQHGVAHGNFEDYHVLDEIAHAYLAVGALKLSGGMIKAGAKKFGSASKGPNGWQESTTKKPSKAAEPAKKKSPDKIRKQPKKKETKKQAQERLRKELETNQQMLKDTEASLARQQEQLSQLKEMMEEDLGRQEEYFSGYQKMLGQWSNLAFLNREQMTGHISPKTGTKIPRKGTPIEAMYWEYRTQGEYYKKAADNLAQNVQEYQKAIDRINKNISESQNTSKKIREENAKILKEIAEKQSFLQKKITELKKRWKAFAEKMRKERAEATKKGIESFHKDHQHHVMEIVDHQGEGATAYMEVVKKRVAEIDKNPLLAKNPDMQAIRTELLVDIETLESLAKNEALFNDLWKGKVDREVEQGLVGNCYLIAAIKALKMDVKLYKEVISKSIRQVGPGKWIVTFQGGEMAGKPIEVTNETIAAFGVKRMIGAKGDIILETAFASYVSRVKNKGEVGHTRIAVPDSKGKLRLPVEGGYSTDALKVLLGDRVSSEVTGNRWAPFSKQHNGQKRSHEVLNNHLNSRRGEYLVAAYSKYVKGGDTKYEVVDGTKVYFNHAYTVIAYNPKTKVVTLSNPHDSQRHFELKKSDFDRLFDTVGAVKKNDLHVTLGRLQEIKSPNIMRRQIRNMLGKGKLTDLFGVRRKSQLASRALWVISSQKNPLVRRVLGQELKAVLAKEGITLNVAA